MDEASDCEFRLCPCLGYVQYVFVAGQQAWYMWLMKIWGGGGEGELGELMMANTADLPSFTHFASVLRISHKADSVMEITKSLETRLTGNRVKLLGSLVAEFIFYF